tara:strand:- start:45 stop:509 length:465 start_codon:yes stop_codon:yes gene_type:complete
MKMYIGRNNNLPWPKNHDKYAIWARSRYEAMVVLAKYLDVYKPGDPAHGSVVHRQGVSAFEAKYVPPPVYGRMVHESDHIMWSNPYASPQSPPGIYLVPSSDDTETIQGCQFRRKEEPEDVDELDDKFIPNPRNHEGVSIHPECKITRNPRNSA